jgi:DNA-binding transcriptional ArsR family regulator
VRSDSPYRARSELDSSETLAVGREQHPLPEGHKLRQESDKTPIDLSTLRSWTFITNHAQVLLALARNPKATVAELAEAAQITERSAYRVLADLQRAGYVRRRKVGRHNSYEINPRLPLRDPIIENELVNDLLRLVGDKDVDAHVIHLRSA